jgi:hypothetical protein
VIQSNDNVSYYTKTNVESGGSIMAKWTLADYHAWDDEIELSDNDEYPLNVSIPDDYDQSRRVFLGYHLHSPILLPGSPTARYDIDFNDITIVNEEVALSDANSYVRWKVVKGDKLRIGDNTIQFRVGDIGLPVKFTDVVLFWQRTVTTD